MTEMAKLSYQILVVELMPMHNLSLKVSIMLVVRALVVLPIFSRQFPCKIMDSQKVQCAEASHQIKLSLVDHRLVEH